MIHNTVGIRARGLRALSIRYRNRGKEAALMPGKRQPTDIVKAKGLKHMTQAEEDARRDQEVHVPPPDKAMPPKWLPKKHHNEFCEIGEILRTAGLYAELDRDVLAQYFVCRERWLHADKLAAKAIRDKDEKLAKEWSGIQSSYFKQARQCAESMGLSVTSRCRIVVPTAVVNAAGAAPEDDADEFTRTLRARQSAAMGY